MFYHVCWATPLVYHWIAKGLQICRSALHAAFSDIDSGAHGAGENWLYSTRCCGFYTRVEENWLFHRKAFSDADQNHGKVVYTLLCSTELIGNQWDFMRFMGASHGILPKKNCIPRHQSISGGFCPSNNLWPFKESKLEVPTICKPYDSGLNFRGDTPNFYGLKCGTVPPFGGVLKLRVPRKSSILDWDFPS